MAGVLFFRFLQEYVGPEGTLFLAIWLGGTTGRRVVVASRPSTRRIAQRVSTPLPFFSFHRLARRLRRSCARKFEKLEKLGQFPESRDKLNIDDAPAYLSMSEHFATCLQLSRKCPKILGHAGNSPDNSWGPAEVSQPPRLAGWRQGRIAWTFPSSREAPKLPPWTCSQPLRNAVECSHSVAQLAKSFRPVAQRSPLCLRRRVSSRSVGGGDTLTPPLRWTPG